MTVPIITLTTIPSRLENTSESGLKSCINSLLDQDWENYQVWINIPLIHSQSGREYNIPPWLEKLVEIDTKLKVYRTEDLGPATKLIPTVERISNSDQIIIVADDDLVYHKGMVRAQVSNQEKWPESIVGYDGLRGRTEDGKPLTVFGDSRDHYCVSIRMNVKVDIIQHYKTVSYKRRFFEEDFFNFCKEWMTWDDDKLMASYFSHKKRDRRVTFHETDPVIESWEEWLNKGGVLTFPVLRHTNHEEKEGCFIYRQETDGNFFDKYYKRFIDKGYE